MKSKFFGYIFSISALSIFAFNFLFSGTKVQSQKVETQNGNEKPILIKPSTILEDLDKYKKSNPQIYPLAG
ncbi:MAG TPA: hypothetical protein VK892_09830 [Pyrinomonadaceae bacterium]|nr:hypothetical protein [Pyrinomonadaceae bacterium]